MRSGPLALRAAGAALALVLAPGAATALAHDGVQVTLTPSTAAPGADVDVRAQGCEGTTGAAKSPAFVADAELTGRDGGARALFGGATVRTGLQDGTYRITVTCDGHDHPDVGTLTVRHHQERPDHRPAPAVPVAPVRAGGGGAAAFAAPAAPGVAQTAGEDGLGTPYTLVGLGMAAVAAVAVAFRSSRRGRTE
ncbi:hypothetical protein ACF1E9_04570 [Streptomyces roseolus]|uniref:hypothetical protein n=1 Tax=Streptomyces TaxID=1883 RepID=UPI0036E8078A